jgi:hypothetical protein
MPSLRDESSRRDAGAVSPAAHASRREDLDRLLASEALVEGAVDLPHPAAADEVADLVGAGPRAGGEGHRGKYAKTSAIGRAK